MRFVLYFSINVLLVKIKQSEKFVIGAFPDAQKAGLEKVERTTIVVA